MLVRGQGGGASVMLPYCLCVCLLYWLVVFASCAVPASYTAFAFHIAVAFHVAFALHSFISALALCWPQACIAAGSCAVACCAIVPSSALLKNIMPWTLFLCALLCHANHATCQTVCKKPTARSPAQLSFSASYPAEHLE